MSYHRPFSALARAVNLVARLINTRFSVQIGLLVLLAALTLPGAATADLFAPDLLSGGGSVFETAQSSVLSDQAIGTQLDQSALEASLSTPEADAERAKSLTAYDNLDAVGALAVDKSEFQHPFGIPLWHPPVLSTDEHIVSYPDDFSAKVGSSKFPGYQLIDSTEPLRTENKDGDKVPVSVALQDDGAMLEPRDPLVRTTISKNLWNGVAFRDSGFSFAPENPPALATPTVVAGKAFFANVSVDTDFLVGPRPTGVSAFFVLRSPQSTEHPTLRFNLASGEGLQLDPAGSGAAQIVDSGGVVANIAPPIAKDALGAPVAATYAVSGNALTIDVPHVGAEIAYPVLVDPTITDDQGTWKNNSAIPITGWSFKNPWPQYFTGDIETGGQWGRGLYQWPWVGCCLPANLWSAWRYPAPNASFVTRAEFDLESAYQGNTCVSAGIVQIDGANNESSWQTSSSICNSDFDGYITTKCVVADCSPTVGARNEAIYQLSSPGGSVSAKAFLGGAKVWLHDFNNPEITSTGHPSGWFDSGQTPFQGVQTHDDGLGVSTAGMNVWNSDGAVVDWAGDFLGPGCQGTSRYPCPANWVPEFDGGVFDLLWDGSYQLEYDAWDAVGNVGQVRPQIHIDTVEPSLSIDQSAGASTLFDGREQYLDKALYTLSVSAEDGNPYDNGRHWTDASGIGTFTVAVDGTELSPAAGSCPRYQKSCDLSFQINPYNYSPGHHNVTITVRDALDTGTPHDAIPEDGSTRSFGFYSVLGTTTSPTGGLSTGKRLTLAATAASGFGLTTAKFQYNLDKTTSPTAKCDELGALSTWTDIPASALRDSSNGTVPSNVLSLAADKTPAVTWDAAASVMTDQAVCVRALFSGSTNGPSQAVRVQLDRSGPGSQRAAVDIGPGTVDPVTGNFSYRAEDLSITAPVSNLSVSRTFNSRSPGSLPSNGPLGPGWQIDLPVPEAASDYRGVDASNLSLDSQVNKGFAILTMTDGSQVGFARSGSGYLPEPGFEQYSLAHVPADAPAKSAITDFILKDADGNQIDFQRSSGDAFRPVSVQEPAGTGTQTTYSFSVLGGVPRPIRALAPVPADIPGDSAHNCKDALGVGTVEAGCRILEFVYAPASTTPPGSGSTGDYPNRLKEIKLTAAAPSGSPPTSFTVQPITVQSYEYDANGRLTAAWDPRISPALKETYTYFDTGSDAGRLRTIKPPGLNEWSLSYSPPRPSVSLDPDAGRLSLVARETPTEDGSIKTAKTSVAYDVLLGGSGAPYQMDGQSLAATGQTDIPTDATAVFPPDQVPDTTPPGSYSRATIYYADAAGRSVNVAQPGGRISTTEYDARGNVIRELTPSNRARALSLGTTAQDHAAQAAKLDTQRQYATNGIDLLDEWGPLHTVRLADGSKASERRHLRNIYSNSGAPNPTTDYHLVTSSTVAAAPSVGAADVAGTVRTTTYGYGGAENATGLTAPGQANIGWTLRKPTTVVDDAGLVHATLYDSATGRVTETRMPRSPYGGDASATQTLYYVAGTHSSDSACGSGGNRAGWDGMVCRVQPAVQPPLTAARPRLPLSLYEYNQLGQQTKSAESVETTAATETRIASTIYDAAGRRTSSGITSTSGSAVPSVTYSYNSTTGLPTTDSDASRTITRAYDAVGRMTNYTDGDSSQPATTTYDLLSRPVVTNDLKGTQTRTYDTGSSGDARGLVTKIVDSQAGTFSATYDDDGQSATESYPNGLIACTTYDETGDATRLVYRKSSSCSSGTVWLDDNQDSSIHGQWLHHENAQLSSSQDYTFDGAGRLTLVKDTVSGKCTTRSYDYSGIPGKDSNRTKLTTRPSATSSCDTSSTGTIVDSAYDEVDRASDNGFTYDAFGRTLQIPAAQGGTAMSATYFVNDRLASVSQGTTTRNYAIDPAWRVRQRTASDTTTQTYHYADDGDAPSWTQDKPTGNTQWTRNVDGIDGDLVALVVNGTTTLQLSDLHGDTIATASPSTSATSLLSTMESDEFGVPRSSAGYRYGWLGGKQRRTEFSSGAIAMGARLYVPQLGRFMQKDPIPGGSCNDYDYACQDPVNNYDLAGTCLGPLAVVCVIEVADIVIGLAATATAALATSAVVSWASSEGQLDLPHFDPFRWSKGGKQNKKHTDLQHLSDQELERLHREGKLPPQAKKKIKTELKVRKKANQQKRRGK